MAAQKPEDEQVEDHLDWYDLDLGLDEEIEEILPYRNVNEENITFVKFMI